MNLQDSCCFKHAFDEETHLEVLLSVRLQSSGRRRPCIPFNESNTDRISAVAFDHPTSRSLPESYNEVLRAVALIPENTLWPVAGRDAAPAYQPKTLLAILIYFYAEGVRSSEDIERNMTRDVNFRNACHDEFPTAGHLRRFRRHNRKCVIEGLAKVLSARVHPFNCESDVVQSEIRPFLRAAKERVDLAILMDMEE